MFSRIAPTYDLLNSLLSLRQDHRWRRVLAAGVMGDHLRLVLDLCAGTGDVVLACARAISSGQAKEVGGGRLLVAVDFAWPMLERAVEKFRSAGIEEGTACIGADVLALPFADGVADAITCAYGVRNLEDLQAGLREFHRCLAPGGRLGILEFFRPHRPILRVAFTMYFHRVLPWVGRMISRDREAYRYLPTSVHDFVTREEFRRLLERVGFEEVQFRELSFGISTAVFARRIS